ncbi:hypothetical protein [Psychroserpens sp. Hel_I_66]|uniref:hypothetical protein n=1 Tax=Psychroserpens sp. Hel_I_66 TaxID=1250004 RepID=UPI000648EA7E|nr:hypothetical protein [Psychroserpens sp. Hel_I_66]
MKYSKIFSILFFCSAVCFYSCDDKNKNSKKETVETVNVPDTKEEKAPTAKLKEPAQNADGVWHYTCKIGCSGGAGTATKCKTCGSFLAHNTEYHAKSSSSSTAAPFANPSSAKTPEPAQNAAGVWHYTCKNGHAGGAGSAVACNTCSTTLTHNSAYH